MKTAFNIILLSICLVQAAFGQAKKQSIALDKLKDLIQINAQATVETYSGKKSLSVNDVGENSEVKFVKISDLDFKDGVIEVELAGKPSAKASGQARGFVGVAFRINYDHTKFECIYLRPTNGRADDQIRRNHSVQYISYPDFPWPKLRKEFPEQYESYVDLVPGEWTKVKIEVKGDKAKLYVHGNPQPTLIVNDLKLGADNKGSIGLWIGPGTEAHFTNLSVTKSEP